ncbi:MAG TPA: sigma-54 dependent transcriptional regulator [Rhodanobacteraceae bacterium]|jgi:DNA-binding NtrC family response regulator|nr:sigma-54 dependent transcriptional regulator [Rhodanobacteraceae bacterium]
MPNPARPNILIADDQRDVREALRLLLKAEGVDSAAADGPRAALDALRKHRFDAALIDLNYARDTTSGAEGIDLLREIKKVDTDLPVVVMTAWGTIDLAVEAMRHGAGDFIEKPWDNQRLMSVIRNQLALADSRGETARLKRENEILRDETDEEFIAESLAMKSVLAQLDRVAPTDANVLILGENGTGKGVVARRLHARSARAAKTLVKVNMGGIPESVFEAEMFGHVRGAFTDAKSDRIGRFELADGGSLFLDEIANIPLAQQPKLLRVLEDGELERVGSSRTLKVDVRLVSATNADLAAEVARGTFRRDLLFRLNTVELRLPPLRERDEDIALLAEAFLAHFARRYQRDSLRLSPSALHALKTYAWPGNVRELSHVIERAVLMLDGDTLDESALNLKPEATHALSGAAALAANGSMTVDEAEEQLVRQALERTGGNIQRAATLLGLSRPSLYRRMEKYNIE